MPRKRGQPHKIDISGQRFGRWEVMSRAKGSKWHCRCDCGAERVVTGSSLKLGKSQSCGCYSRERSTTHGMERTSIYNIWAHMLRRCTNPNASSYAHYGGRGIKVCDRWRSFENFYADMGDRPTSGHSLDRINNNGNYEPGNVRWATAKQNIRNRRTTATVTINSRTLPVADIAEAHGIKPRIVRDRLRRGLTIEEAVSRERRGRWGVTRSKVK